MAVIFDPFNQSLTTWRKIIRFCFTSSAPSRSSRGGAVDILTQTILAQHGVSGNKDATLIVIGSPEELVTALRTGRIAACLLTQPRQLILYRDGFTKLAYSGDYLSSYPTGGVGTTEEKIKNHPAEVLSFVRARLKG